LSVVSPSGSAAIDVTVNTPADQSSRTASQEFMYAAPSTVNGNTPVTVESGHRAAVQRAFGRSSHHQHGLDSGTVSHH
jgi:hypothetical protein